jgi:hypothetical protein
MNYYDARQRQSDQKWDFTCQNDNRIWAVGKCADKQCNHDTPDEARACYGQWLIDNRLELEAGTLHKQWVECEVEGCDHDTDTVSRVGQYYRFMLCQTHRTKEQVAKMVEVGSFFGSY